MPRPKAEFPVDRTLRSAAGFKLSTFLQMRGASGSTGALRHQAIEEDEEEEERGDSHEQSQHQQGCGGVGGAHGGGAAGAAHQPLPCGAAAAASRSVVLRCIAAQVPAPVVFSSFPFFRILAID